MSEYLKPCLFCGKTDLAHAPIIGAAGWHEIKCRTCGFSIARITEKESRDFWNTRAETRPTHSDNGECDTCEGKGMIPANPGNPGEGPEPCPTCQPSDKLEGEPERWSEEDLTCPADNTGTDAANHITDLYAHIDRLNAKLVKERASHERQKI